MQVTLHAGANDQIRVCQPCITRSEACQPVPAVGLTIDWVSLPSDSEARI